MNAPKAARKTFRKSPSLIPLLISANFAPIRVWTVLRKRTGGARMVWRYVDVARLNIPPVRAMVSEGFVMPYPQKANTMKSGSVSHISHRLSLMRMEAFVLVKTSAP